MHLHSSWLHTTLLLGILFCTACTSQITTDKALKLPNSNCAVAPYTVKHAFPRGGTPWSRAIDLPAKGRFVEESHYVTLQDEFGEDKWPARQNESISNHLKRSLRRYKNYDRTASLEKLYAQSWQKEWTPEEGGHFGQGAVGNAQLNELSPEMEMWFMTMMWASGERPERGTKFLLSANGKNVIVIAGYETGPASENYLGGITREVHYWLGTDTSSEITVALLKDQNTPIGPVRCR